MARILVGLSQVVVSFDILRLFFQGLKEGFGRFLIFLQFHPVQSQTQITHPGVFRGRNHILLISFGCLGKIPELFKGVSYVGVGLFIAKIKLNRLLQSGNSLLVIPRP